MQRPATGDDDDEPAPKSQPGSRQSLRSEPSGSPSAASINIVTALPSVRRASSPLPRQGFPADAQFLPSSSQQSGITTTGDNTKPASRFSDAVSSAIGRARALSSESGGRDSPHPRRTQTQGHQPNADSSFGIDADPFAGQLAGPSHRRENVSLLSEPNSSPVLHVNDASFPRKHRGSLLVAASDALGFGRVGASISKRMGKRSSLDQNASPAIRTQPRKGLPWKGKVKPKGHWALQPSSSSQLATDVIEISAAKTGLTAVRDEEDESERRERDRLREAAAESIGIGSLFREDASSRITESDGFRYDDESVEDNDFREHPNAKPDDDPARRPNALDRSRANMNGGTSQQHRDAGLQTRQIRENTHNRSSSVSGVITPTAPTSTSGWPHSSLFPPLLTATTRSQKNSVEANAAQQLPPFPCIFSALDPMSNKSTSLLKFIPSSHLLRLGFSRQWRTRTIVLTAPRQPTSPSFYTFRSFMPAERSQSVCHLHVFKSSRADERELERLEVNENSVVFVAEEEISGKRSVVKVGGVDVGARRRELNVEENGQTMWLLSLFDASEAQEWITSLKSAVLDQRAAKAGLAMPTHSSSLAASGPKGDLDVMLSMRAQFVASTVRAQSRTVASPNDEVLARGSESPTPTTKSWTSERRRPVSPSGRIISLKGLFSVPGRARSMSRGRNDKDSPTTPIDAPSFTSRGTTLLNMIRPPAEADTKSSPSSPRVVGQTLPVPVPVPDPGSILPKAELNLEKASLWERDKELPPWYSLQQNQNNRGDASSSLTTGRLLPPPRSRRPWTSAGLLSNNTERDRIVDTIPPSRKSFQSAVSLHGARLSLEEKSRPSSPDDSADTATEALRATEMGSRRASLSSSVSSFVPSIVDRDQSTARTSLSVQRRMRAGRLPMMASPPAGPPPAVPHSALSPSTGDSNSRSLSDRSPSRPSSVRSITNSDAIPGDGMVTGGRLSESSSFGTGSRGTSGSLGNYNSLRNSLSQKRISIPPPPRPAPTSALPPTPAETQGNSPPRRSSFRESLSHRFSLSPQNSKTPRDETLRPRSASSGPISSVTTLHAASISIAPPAPPPTRPLPPTPRDPSAHRYSIRERLRMKSAPPVPPTGIRGASSPPTTLPGSLPLVTVESVASLKDSIPPGPIGEPITAIPKDLNFLNMSSPIDSSTSTDDADFLNMSTPLTTTFPKQISSDYRLPERPNDSPPMPEMTGLPPPPRRGRNGKG